jgi:hypothetical protein
MILYQMHAEHLGLNTYSLTEMTLFWEDPLKYHMSHVSEDSRAFCG